MVSTRAYVPFPAPGAPSISKRRDILRNNPLPLADWQPRRLGRINKKFVKILFHCDLSPFTVLRSGFRVQWSTTQRLQRSHEISQILKIAYGRGPWAPWPVGRGTRESSLVASWTRGPWVFTKSANGRLAIHWRFTGESTWRFSGDSGEVGEQSQQVVSRRQVEVRAAARNPHCLFVSGLSTIYTSRTPPISLI